MATGLDKVVDEKGVDELLEILNDIAGKWEQFLSQLKVSESKRQQIKTDHRESQLCLMYGLHEWRKSNERPTYQMIVDALRSSFVGCQELAMRIEDKLGHTPKEESATGNISPQASSHRGSDMPSTMQGFTVNAEPQLGTTVETIAKETTPPPGGTSDATGGDKELKRTVEEESHLDTGAQEEKLKKYKKCMRCFQFFFVISCIAIASLTIAVVCLTVNRPSNEVALLGVNNDTVVAMDTPQFPLDNPIEIRECPSTADSYHGLDVFLLSEEEFSRYRLFQTRSQTSRVFNQTGFSRDTGLIDYRYLAKGSVINYTLHYSIERMPDPGETYKLYLFDDEEKYFNYVQGIGDDAIAYRNLPFDSKNNSVRLDYVIDHSSYYFIAAKTPANLLYQFSYVFKVAYFDHKTLYEDGLQKCTVSYSHPCSVSIPVEGSHYLLAYIHASEPDDVVYLTTHICIRPLDQTAYVASFVPFIVVVTFIAVLFSCGICCVFRKAMKIVNAKCYEVCGCACK